MPSSITAIILTKDEEMHIARCIDNVAKVARRIVVVDSGSTDATCRVAREHGAEVVEMPWAGNQAAQFNLALDSLDISTEWILRLDADEWLSDGLIDEINTTLPKLPAYVVALELPLGRYFMGRRLRHGVNGTINIVRLFRSGKARYENRLMDEHLKVDEGEIRRLKNKFFDDNRRPLSHFIAKHDQYALREAATMLIAKYNLAGDCNPDSSLATTAKTKRRQKSRYARMPRYWRAAAYFCYRYFLRLGFLDGKEGFLWDFMQGWWYRTLVDAKIQEIETATGRDPERIAAHLRDQNLL